MIRTKTVFILGAGTSADFGFPAGPKLLTDIRRKLDYRFEFGTMRSGDEALLDALIEYAGERRGGPCPETDRLIEAGRKLVAAAASARSIDSAIDTLEDDEVAIVGKLGIASTILEAEAQAAGNWNKDRGSRGLKVDQLNGTWIPPFMEILTSDLRRSQVDQAFQSVAIINFNYDRTVELILPALLAEHFSIQIGEAQSALAAMPYFRPYGRLGRLDWEKSKDPLVRFGDLRGACLASQALQTFTEQVRNEEQLAAMRATLSSADRAVFLGFGFHRQNLQLLAHDHVGSLPVVGTALGLPEVSVVARELGTAFVGPDGRWEEPELLDCKSAILLERRARTLTS